MPNGSVSGVLRRGSARTLLLATVVLSVIAASSLVRGATTAEAAPNLISREQGGEWSAVGRWDFIPLHAALASDGRLLTYGLDGGDTRLFDSWDPAGGIEGGHQREANQTNSWLYCSITVADPGSDGLMILGGTETAEGAGNNNFALRYGAGQITQLGADEQMLKPRWYPSATPLWDGRILVQGGTDNGQPDAGGEAELTPEIYTPGEGWKLLNGARSYEVYGADINAYNYPRSWVTPAGKIFGVTGPNMYWINPEGNGSIEIIGRFPSTEFGAVRGATSAAVMYDDGLVLQVGGDGGRGAVIIDLTSDEPRITPTAPMTHARVSADATVLPDGRVLVSGGASEWLDLSDVAYAPEIWDPATGQWTEMNPNALPRLYHSAAVLLPDASVWTGGGGQSGPPDPNDLNGDGNTEQLNNLNAEVFYPPYLFKDGNRAVQPTITQAPDTIGHSGSHTFTVSRPGTGAIPTIETVSLVRNGNSTHSTNSQTWQQLDHTQSGNQISFSAPDSKFVTPPGDYLLFAIDSDGVPSVAAHVQVRAEPPPLESVPTGPVRLANARTSGFDYLIRDSVQAPDGTWLPGRYGSLDSLVNPSTGESRSQWRSLQWEFLPAENGRYRIRNRWAPENGYLTRLGRLTDGQWVEQPSASFEAFADWGSQQWTVTRSENGFTIANDWHPESGVLTRDANADSSAGRTFSLRPPGGGTPQRWLLRAVE